MTPSLIRHSEAKEILLIAVRLEDGSTVYGFGANAVAAKNAAGTPDPYWQRAAEASVQESADVYDGLMALPGAKLIHAGVVRPAPPALPEPKPERRRKATVGPARRQS